MQLDEQTTEQTDLVHALQTLIHVDLLNNALLSTTETGTAVATLPLTLARDAIRRGI